MGGGHATDPPPPPPPVRCHAARVSKTLPRTVSTGEVTPKESSFTLKNCLDQSIRVMGLHSGPPSLPPGWIGVMRTRAQVFGIPTERIASVASSFRRLHLARSTDGGAIKPSRPDCVPRPAPNTGASGFPRQAPCMGKGPVRDRAGVVARRDPSLW